MEKKYLYGLLIFVFLSPLLVFATDCSYNSDCVNAPEGPWCSAEAGGVRSGEVGQCGSSPYWNVGGSNNNVDGSNNNDSGGDQQVPCLTPDSFQNGKRVVPVGMDSVNGGGYNPSAKCSLFPDKDQIENCLNMRKEVFDTYFTDINNGAVVKQCLLYNHIKPKINKLCPDCFAFLFDKSKWSDVEKSLGITCAGFNASTLLSKFGKNKSATGAIVQLDSGYRGCLRNARCGGGSSRGVNFSLGSFLGGLFGR